MLLIRQVLLRRCFLQLHNDRVKFNVVVGLMKMVRVAAAASLLVPGEKLKLKGTPAFISKVITAFNWQIWIESVQNRALTYLWLKDIQPLLRNQSWKSFPF